MNSLDPNLALDTALTSSRSIPNPTWSLHGESVQGSSGVHAISANPFTIGRSGKNTLCLSDPTVSGQHAELVALADAFVVRDLGSTNGTYLNGRKVERHELLGPGDVLQFGAVAFELRNEVVQSSSNGTLAKDVSDDAVAFVQFEKMLHDRAVVPFFQPIVDCNAVTRAYEILARSRLYGLESPEAMFRAATRLQSEVALSRMIRQEGVAATEAFPADVAFFLNTHPTELLEPGLLESMWALRQAFPRPRIVLEIHESAVTDVAMLRSLATSLVDLDVKLAYDDFGAGQSRLLELTDVLPAFVKFDIGLVRGLDTAPAQRRQMVESLVRMVLDLGVIPLAEGVETEGEAAACWDAGFVLAQGYLYGRPAGVREYAPSAPNSIRDSHRF